MIFTSIGVHPSEKKLISTRKLHESIQQLQEFNDLVKRLKNQNHFQLTKLCDHPDRHFNQD